MITAQTLSPYLDLRILIVYLLEERQHNGRCGPRVKIIRHTLTMEKSSIQIFTRAADLVFSRRVRIYVNYEPKELKELNVKKVT